MKVVCRLYGILFFLLAMVHFSVAQNPVYERFASREELTVAYVSKYRIDSVTAVDVVLVHANDSAGWTDFQREMNVPDETIESQLADLKKGWINPIYFYYSKKNQPEARITSTEEEKEYDLVIFSLSERTLFVFDVKSREQGLYLFHIFVSNTFKNIKK